MLANARFHAANIAGVFRHWVASSGLGKAMLFALAASFISDIRQEGMRSAAFQPCTVVGCLWSSAFAILRRPPNREITVST